MVSKQVREYMERTGEVLPTRGIIHEIGRALTHKRTGFTVRVIRLQRLQGKLTLSRHVTGISRLIRRL